MNKDRYSVNHIHFMDSNIPDILEKLLRSNKVVSIIDLGCGDGRFFYALNNKGILHGAEKIVGVDISQDRINRLKSHCPFAEGLVADICNIAQVDNDSFDIAVSSKVIEHITDDTMMLKETHRIIKPKGYLYISTVIKKWYGIWVYWNSGFKCDPTHIREYRSKKEFMTLLKRNGFEIIEYKISNISYSVMDLIIRIFIRLNLIRPNSEFYLEHAILGKIRQLINLKIVGYQNIEVICKIIK